MVSMELIDGQRYPYTDGLFHRLSAGSGREWYMMLQIITYTLLPFADGGGYRPMLVKQLKMCRV